jgi:hypothetical protein
VGAILKAGERDWELMRLLAQEDGIRNKVKYYKGKTGCENMKVRKYVVKENNS